MLKGRPGQAVKGSRIVTLGPIRVRRSWPASGGLGHLTAQSPAGTCSTGTRSPLGLAPRSFGFQGVSSHLIWGSQSRGVCDHRKPRE